MSPTWKRPTPNRIPHLTSNEASKISNLLNISAAQKVQYTSSLVQHATTGDTDETVHRMIPFPVSTYTSAYAHTLDARLFEALCSAGERRLFVHIEGFGAFHTSVYAWRERFLHLDGRGVALLSLVPLSLYMPFARCD